MAKRMTENFIAWRDRDWERSFDELAGGRESMSTALRIEEQYCLLLYLASGATRKLSSLMGLRKLRLALCRGTAETATGFGLRSFACCIKGQALSRLGISLLDRGRARIESEDEVGHALAHT